MQPLARSVNKLDHEAQKRLSARMTVPSVKDCHETCRPRNTLSSFP